MTTMDLVEVVAEVLRVHGFTELEHGYWYCSCGHDLGVPIPDDLHAAHQARAVLAALTEAGSVEWGNMAEGADRPFESFGPDKQAELAAKSFARVYGIPVVSRLTLPRTAVK